MPLSSKRNRHHLPSFRNIVTLVSDRLSSSSSTPRCDHRRITATVSNDSDRSAASDCGGGGGGGGADSNPSAHLAAKIAQHNPYHLYARHLSQDDVSDVLLIACPFWFLTNPELAQRYVDHHYICNNNNNNNKGNHHNHHHRSSNHSDDVFNLHDSQVELLLDAQFIHFTPSSSSTCASDYPPKRMSAHEVCECASSGRSKQSQESHLSPTTTLSKPPLGNSASTSSSTSSNNNNNNNNNRHHHNHHHHHQHHQKQHQKEQQLEDDQPSGPQNTSSNNCHAKKIIIRKPLLKRFSSVF